MGQANVKTSLAFVDKRGFFPGRNEIIGVNVNINPKSKPSVAGLIWKGGAAA